MSHRWDCPRDWEARHEGERAFDYGRSRSSNPYEDTYWNRDHACHEAAEEWDRGYRRAEMRAEEEREEEAARQRAARRRAEAEAEEAYFYPEPAYEPEPYSEDEYVRAQCESSGHAQYDEAGDRFGPRCYCGRVHWAQSQATPEPSIGAGSPE